MVGNDVIVILRPQDPEMTSHLFLSSRFIFQTSSLFFIGNLSCEFLALY